MLRFACPRCHEIAEAADDKAGTQARCSQCGQSLLIPGCEVAQVTMHHGSAKTVLTEATANRRSVQYLHHTRDPDGDIIFYFSDPQTNPDGAVEKSSPVVAMRRVANGVVDRGGSGLARYILTTQNSEYEIQMVRDKASHLAMELGIALPC